MASSKRQMKLEAAHKVVCDVCDWLKIPALPLIIRQNAFQGADRNKEAIHVSALNRHNLAAAIWSYYVWSCYRVEVSTSPTRVTTSISSRQAAKWETTEKIFNDACTRYEFK